MRLTDVLLALLAPHDCLGCGAEGALLCSTCRRDLAPPLVHCYKCLTVAASFATCAGCRPGSPLRMVAAATAYRGAAKDIIWKLKFGRARSGATEVAALIASRLGLRRQLGRLPAVIITHAPTATTRVRQRGYDQAQLIARCLARSCGVPYRPLLARYGHQKQIGASKAQRAAQLSGAFHAAPLQAARIRGAHIILVDDVVTTGATLEAAAKTLMDAGARRVDAVVFAQA